ncbi:hypothetical protein KFL_001580130 [Klebsormidium nitens]|uniref:Uncharacterized protein n=1 Tax=Klebsormidium nitens TaxID=105231 RepID=A0A1Y1I2P3_KLENI|nr:hypothetical protein KFL_001580130 [Klebsormidium nitens]|eukprot:GAQ83699.1 hypothetical protein KFL_001580130 [Klebsormidium nitens]
MQAPVSAKTADVSASLARQAGDDNKENVGVFGRQGWRELSFEERLKGAAKSKAEVTAAAVQTVHGLQQGLENLRSSPVRRVSIDALPMAANVEAAGAKAGSTLQERLSVGERCGSQGASAETEAKGRWTRMWTQLPEEGQLADVSRGNAVDLGAGGQEKGLGKATAVGKGVASEVREASLHMDCTALGADIAQLPSQVDATSYLLGERAALERAFQQVVPHRDQVTTLHGVVAQLQSVTQQESSRLRRLENAGGVLHLSMSTATERLERIEQTVPALEISLAELRGHLEGMAYMSAELTAVRASLAALQANQEHIKERLSYSSSTFFKFLTGSWGRLLGYLARADVAALYLARKILLDTSGEKEPLLPIYAPPPPSADADSNLHDVSKFEWSADHVHALARAISRHRKVRSAAGAILVVAAVEATWRLQKAARKPLPRVLRSMTVPLDTCLRVARICVWASAFVVGAEELKKGCYSAADSVAKLQDNVAEGIKTRGTILADGLAAHSLVLRDKWGQMWSRLAHVGDTLGFEGAAGKSVSDGDDVEEVLIADARCRAVGYVHGESFPPRC